MKTFLLVVLSSFALIASGQMNFVDPATPWKDILAMSAKEHKPIFMDAFTTWCGPCKMMAKNTFPDTKVGEFYNANFINVKMDMEKGQGLDLARTYQVRAYPTLLFIDSEGKIIHRTAGYMDAGQFITLGKSVENPANQLGAMTKKYEGGERDSEFLLKYATALFNGADIRGNEVGEEYLKSQKDWKSSQVMDFIMRYSSNPESSGFKYLMENKTLFSEKYNTEKVSGKIEEVITNKVYELADEGKLAEIQPVFALAYPPKDAARMASRVRMNHFSDKGNMSEYLKESKSYFSKNKITDPEEFTEVGLILLDSKTNDPKNTLQATKFVNKGLKLEPTVNGFQTLGRLFNSIQKYKQARKALLSGIELAKIKGDDTTEMQSIIDEMKK
jgi:thioredoxin-related protein